MRGAVLNRALSEALDAAWFFGDGPRATRVLDAGLARDPIERLSITEAPYRWVITAYAQAGHPDRARAIMAQWDERRRTSPSIRDTIRAPMARGVIALAARQYGVAQTELRTADKKDCPICN